MAATPAQTVNAANFIILVTAILVFVPSSEASYFWQSPQKTVNVQNWDTTQMSIRCFSFDEDHDVVHLKPQEGFSFTFRQSLIFPSTTMWNCSTTQGTVAVFKNYYDCNNQNHLCTWRFTAEEAYRYSPGYKKWIRYDFSPTYESLSRGGLVKEKRPRYNLNGK